jgi:hypothetical protein
MDEGQIRALGALSRPGLEIKLLSCRIKGASAEALAEVLKRNQGPTEIRYCDFDNFVLADGLRGNSRLKKLETLCFTHTSEDRNREVLAILAFSEKTKALLTW